MTFQNLLKHKTIYLAMAFWMFLLSSAPNNSFGITIGSYSSLRNEMRQQDIEKIKQFLSRDIVKNKLTDFGLTSQQINERLNRLSDEQIRTLANKIDTIKAGGDGTGVIVVVLLLILVFLLILYIMDYQVKIEKKRK